MSTPLFRITSFSVEYFVVGIDNGTLGLPDLQRPFVWSNTMVRDLLDSLYQGFPTGSLLLWQTPDTQKFRQIGTDSHGATVPSQLILDGQQRLTSLYAVIKGKPVFDKGFNKRHIRIAFKPATGEFEVASAAHARSPEWIENISDLFTDSCSSRKKINAFLEHYEAGTGQSLSPELEETIATNIDRLLGIPNITFSAMEITRETDEEVVAEIFARVNRQGRNLKQTELLCTLLSVFWYEGRLELDHFCRSALVPAKSSEPSPFNYLIEPDTDSLLRTIAAVAFRRGTLKYIEQMLRGRNLETRASSVEERNKNLARFRQAQERALHLQNWKDYLRCLYSAGLRSKGMISSRVAVMFCYALLLIGKHDFAVEGDVLRHVMARWLFWSLLTARYSNSVESQLEKDLALLRNVRDGQEFVEVLDRTLRSGCTQDFWTSTLPGLLETSNSSSPAGNAYHAALVLLDAPVLFSDLKVADMLDQTMRGERAALERHHLFPKAWLAGIGIRDDALRNQIANFALVQWDRNMEIGDEDPATYFPRQLAAQPRGAALEQSLRLHALPDGWENMPYQEFLVRRRRLMADVIREGFERLWI